MTKKKSKKKILVTGGAGFIGSEFVRQLAGRYDIAVIDNMSYAGDSERLKGLGRKIRLYRENICLARKVKDIFESERPSTVVHFAAETHVDRSILESTPFINTNIRGTQNLLDAARDNGVDKFVHISTDEVYGDIVKGSFFEYTPLNPSSPYSASKAGGDLLVKSYARTFGLPAVIIRPSNNYGPWQYPEKFIPVIIFKALNNEKIPVYGKGTNIREWFYVADCARAVARIMTAGRTGEVYNISSGEERKNIEVARLVLDILGKPHSLIEFVRDRPGHDIRYSIDCKKVKKELGWVPETGFDAGMKKTVNWYVRNMDWVESKERYLRRYWGRVYRKKNK